MSYPKIANLIALLRAKTESGDVWWFETEEKGCFQASFSTYSTRIFLGAGRYTQEELDVVFQIINDLGDVVEEVRDSDLSSFIDNTFVYMTDFYESVRRRAMGVDDAIENIMRDLGA